VSYGRVNADGELLFSRMHTAIRGLVATPLGDARAYAFRNLHVRRNVVSMTGVVGGDVGAVPVLRMSVRRAQDALLSGTRDTAGVNAVLVDLAAELAPSFPHLHAEAEARPHGPVAAVLDHLRVAFTYAAAGRPDQVVCAMVTAATTGFRLADDAALDAENVDFARWR
jgi:hypothetical protein